MVLLYMFSLHQSPERSIVNIIDFESVDYSEDSAPYEPLTNNQDMILREIEAQDDESGIDDLCDVDKNLIREGITSLSDIEELRKYCLRVSEYYCDKVNILMRHIYKSNSNDVSISESIKVKDFEITRLQKVLEERKIFDNRLKELEIENTQLKKFKGRFEESEGKCRLLEKKTAFFKNLLDSKDDPIALFSLEDMMMWEEKAFALASKLKDKKSEICQELAAKQNSAPKCVICQTKPVNTIIKDCNHICMCWECAHTVDKCPFDRKRIQSIDKVYLP